MWRAKRRGRTPAAPLSRAGGLPARPEFEGEVERNPIFDALVGCDGEDVAGLVAYSIYKQNKRAWLDDFVKAAGRAPTTLNCTPISSAKAPSDAWRSIAGSPIDSLGRSAVRSAGMGGGADLELGHRPLWALAIIVALAVLCLAIHAGYFTGASSQRTRVSRRAARVSPV